MYIFLKNLDEYISTFVLADFRGIDFSAFQAESPEVAKAKAAVQSWVADTIYHHVVRPLIIYGPTGTGKTMLASCAWNAVAPEVGIRSNLQDIFNAGTADNIAWLLCAKLPDEIMNKDRADGRTKEQVLFHYNTAYFAVIDDLDKCSPSETWAIELFKLIDARLCQYRVPTIITMNHSPTDLCRRYGQEYGPQMLDRMERTGGIFIRMSKDPSVKQKKLEGKADNKEKVLQNETVPVDSVHPKPPPFDRNAFLQKMRDQIKTETSK